MSGNALIEDLPSFEVIELRVRRKKTLYDAKTKRVLVCNMCGARVIKASADFCVCPMGHGKLVRIMDHKRRGWLVFIDKESADHSTFFQESSNEQRSGAGRRK